MNVRHTLADDAGGPLGAGALRDAVRTVLARPSLWWPALCLAARFAPRGWWRHSPFLPSPDERYWRFRMETAYGDESARVSQDELVAVLRWSRRQRRPRR